MFDVAGASQQLHKVLIVSDDEQLEVPLTRATLDDAENAELEMTKNKDLMFNIITQYFTFNKRCEKHYFNYCVFAPIKT